MPQKKRVYRRPKKVPRRKYNRRYVKRRGRYTLKVKPGLGFISPRLITRMKYCDQFTLQILPLATSDYAWRMNSCFDPDKTGIGHQPYGFDQLAALYQRYRVFATHWVIQVAPPNDAVHFCVIPVNGTASYSNFSLVSEQPRAIVKTSSIGSSPIYLKGKCYLPRLGGDKRVEYKADDRFAAQVTANPVEIMDLHMVAYNQSSTVTLTLRIQVTLVFMTEFFDPIPQAQS